ncbi:MAG: TA system VapC family ribonuclease toxin, partial [Casimicrobium sp.]
MAEKALRALYDVNILLALFDPYHLKHEAALQWHEMHGGRGWASCPLTQNGLIRIMSQPKYMNPQSTRDLIAVVAEFARDATHEFWPDSISLADENIIDPNVALSPAMLTDVYLLALAVKNGGRLITLDSRIPLRSVV